MEEDASPTEEEMVVGFLVVGMHMLSIVVCCC